MRQVMEAVTLEGPRIRVDARQPLPVPPRALAVAAAIRVFERYSALDRLTLLAGDVEVTVGREEVERLLGPEGWSRLRDRDGAREAIERAVREFTGEEPA